MASSASTLARLTLDGKEYNVFQAMFESMKPVDQWNRVTAYATKADARFVIEGTEETAALFEKYANSRKQFNAKLTLNKTNGEGKLVEKEFNECSLTYYSSKYDSVDAIPYTITIVISAKTTKIGSGELTFDYKSA